MFSLEMMRQSKRLNVLVHMFIPLYSDQEIIAVMEVNITMPTKMSATNTIVQLDQS